MYFLLKVFVSALVVAGASELGRRSVLLAAVVASLPINSILVILWVYNDTRDEQRVIALSQGIFWALIPSLLFLFLFPLLLRSGMRFGLALAVAILTMIAGYALYVFFLGRPIIRP